MSAHFTYTTEGFTFEWTAGPYIDIYHQMGPAFAVDCINVWDYENDKPRIPVTLDDFREQCDEWVAA
jgi:hypothetical protein